MGLCIAVKRLILPVVDNSVLAASGRTVARYGLSLDLERLGV